MTEDAQLHPFPPKDQIKGRRVEAAANQLTAWHFMSSVLAPTSVPAGSPLFLTSMNLAGGGQAAGGARCHGLALPQISASNILGHNTEIKTLFTVPLPQTRIGTSLI